MKMTTIFTFPLFNAWVIASDKLETNQSESERIKKGYETSPYNTCTKIKSKGRYMYGFAGSSNEIKEIENILRNSIRGVLNFKQFRKIILRKYGDNINALDVELLLIDSNKIVAYKIKINIMPALLNDAKIDSIEEGYIGSGSSSSRATFQTSPLLDSLRDLKIKNSNSKKLRTLLAKTVIAMEILAKKDTQFTGHPAINGCNIGVIMKNKILTYKILPKRYICKEINQSSWFNLEDLENA